jgi:hypothetical protein
MAAYYHDGTKIDELDPTIVAAASRYDPGYYQAINNFYNGMEYNANQLGIDIFQLMELQAIEQEDLWDYSDPANTGKGRRQMQAELADMRAEKQLKRYQEMLNYNIENNPQLLVEDANLLPNPLANQASGINRSNQIAIDEYNTNLRQALSVLQDDYEDAVEVINNQRLYQGRSDLLFFQTRDLYQRYRIDSIPQPDGGVAQNDTGAAPNPQISNTAQEMKQEAINNSTATDKQVLDWYDTHWLPNEDPSALLDNQKYEILTNHYKNNPASLNNPPTYTNDAVVNSILNEVQQYTKTGSIQSKRIQPQEQSVKIQPTPVRQEPVVVDRAPPQAPARPPSPTPQPAPAPQPAPQPVEVGIS